MIHTIKIHNTFLIDTTQIIIPITVVMELDKLDVFIRQITDLSKFFNGNFTQEELDYLKSYHNNLRDAIEYDIMSYAEKRNNIKVANRIKSVIMRNTNVKRNELNDVYHTIYEGIERLGDNEYAVYWYA